MQAGPSGGAKVKKTTSLDYEASSEDSNDSTTRSSLTGTNGNGAGGRKSGNQSGYSSCSETARRGK